jgi:hypothetical protein
MQHVSFEEGKEICLNHVCGVCGAPIVLPWDGKANSYAVRCGKDSTHEGFRRVPSLFEARAEGEALPMESEQQFQRKEAKGWRLKPYTIVNRVTNQEHSVEAESAQEACELCGWKIGDCYVKEDKMLEKVDRPDIALMSLIPREDSADGKALSPAARQSIIDCARMLDLNPYLGHIDIYQGRLRVTIYGRYYDAKRHPEYQYVRSRPLTTNERGDQQIGDGVLAWMAEVVGKNGDVLGQGFGYASLDEEVKLMKGVPEKWGTPQRRAEKRAEEDALAKAFPIGLPPVEEEEAKDDLPSNE